MGFFGFNVAVSGLLSSQRALDVINHNISNAATPGYSRQIVDLGANMPISIPNQGMLGTGVNVNDISRLRNEFLDYKYWSENPSGGEWTKKTGALTELETTLKDSGTGFSSIMDKFYAALSNMSQDPSNQSYRVAVTETASTFTKTINSVVQKLDKEQKDLDDDVAATAGKINSISKQIATLNRQIYSLELDGHTANDLRDQRGVLVDNLSKIVNINVKEITDPGIGMKRMVISIGDIDLVNHIDTHEIVVQRNVANRYSSTDPNFAGTTINEALPYKTSLKWKDSTADVVIESGELKGLIDARDGDGMTGASGGKSSYRGIVYYIKQLDDFAKNFSEIFNNQNSKGYTLEDPPHLAGPFFVSSVGSAKIKANEIKISDTVMNNPSLMGISDYGADNQHENKNNLKKLVEQKDNAHFFPPASNLPDGKPGDFLKSVIAILAVDSQQANRMNDNQQIVLGHVETMRASVSSVDQNEEMANAVKFQQTYTASAKMINVMDAIYDTVINRLGLVGR